MDQVHARVARVDRGAVLVVAAAGAGAPVGTGSLLPDSAGALDVPATRIVLDRDGLVPAADGQRWAPTVGDVVVVGERPDGGSHLVELLPRRTELVRDSAGQSSRTQALAANVDVVLVAEHLDPDPDLGRIERLLTLAWRSGARPVVVLTKVDLIPDASGLIAEVVAAAPGAEVHAVSASQGWGLEPLRAILAQGPTVVVVGPSGAGKSTLVNALAGAELMAVGDRRADGRGRHTTTHRELVMLASGACLIDTPGLRAVGVVADAAAVESAFTDVADLARRCRFGDCAHDREPGCAVRAALDSGELSERRFESWRRLAREAAWQARRSDAGLAALEKARWKQRTVQSRRAVRGR